MRHRPGGLQGVDRADTHAFQCTANDVQGSPAWGQFQGMVLVGSLSHPTYLRELPRALERAAPRMAARAWAPCVWVQEEGIWQRVDVLAKQHPAQDHDGMVLHCGMTNPAPGALVPPVCSRPPCSVCGCAAVGGRPSGLQLDPSDVNVQVFKVVSQGEQAMVVASHRSPCAVVMTLSNTQQADACFCAYILVRRPCSMAMPIVQLSDTCAGLPECDHYRGKTLAEAAKRTGAE